MPAIGMMIIQGLLQYGPEIAAEIAKALHATDYTLEDWLDLIEKCRVNTKQFIKDTERLANTVDNSVPITNSGTPLMAPSDSFGVVSEKTSVLK